MKQWFSRQCIRKTVIPKIRKTNKVSPTISQFTSWRAVLACGVSRGSQAELSRVPH